MAFLTLSVATDVLFRVCPKDDLKMHDTGYVRVTRYAGESQSDVEHSYAAGQRSGIKSHAGGFDAMLLLAVNAAELSSIGFFGMSLFMFKKSSRNDSTSQGT